jgi:hypothetical protein
VKRVGRGSAALLLLLLLLAAVAPLRAQDSRLAARLDKPTLIAVSAVIDSARNAKLPTAPLVEKALEGAAKGSDGEKIVIAVRQLASTLHEARAVLGAKSLQDEIKAAATALDAGVAPHDLGRIRSAAGKRPVTMHLAVLADLVGRNVPIATAANLLVSLARSGVADQDLTTFQRDVRLDIEHGADPAFAATTRARVLLLRGARTNAARKSAA